MPPGAEEVEYMASNISNANMSFFAAGLLLASSKILHQESYGGVHYLYNRQLPNKELEYSFSTHTCHKAWQVALRDNLAISSLRPSKLAVKHVLDKSFNVPGEEDVCDCLLLDIRSTCTILCRRVGSLLPREDIRAMVKSKVIEIMDEILESLPNGSARIVYLASNIATLDEKHLPWHSIKHVAFREKDNDPVIAAECVKELRDVVVSAIHALP